MLQIGEMDINTAESLYFLWVVVQRLPGLILGDITVSRTALTDQQGTAQCTVPQALRKRIFLTGS